MPYIPKKTADKIIETGNHYLLQVKANQPSLLADIESTVEGQTALSTFTKEEKSKGRVEKRVVSVFEVQNLVMKNSWQGLQTYVHVARTRQTETGISVEDAYYISDWTGQQKDAEFFYQTSRGHWKIENNLHYPKDVVHQEDKNKLKNKGAIIASVMSSVAINLSRKNGYPSIEDAQIIFCTDVKNALSLIRT